MARNIFDKSAAKKYSQLHAIFAAQITNTQQNKTTVLPLRLTGYGYTNMGQEEDSVKYIYSGGRGSILPDRNYYSDTYFPGDDQYIQSDTSYQWIIVGANLELYLTKAYQYDNNNRVKSFFYAKSGLYLKYDLTYTNELVTQVDISDTVNGTFKPETRELRIFNTQNRLILDSSYSIATNNPVQSTHYTYDAGGNLIQKENWLDIAGWRMASRKSNTYTGNLLQTSVTEADQGNGLNNNSKDSFAYSGNNLVFEALYDWDPITNNWRPAELQTYHYSTANLVDTLYQQQWGGVKWDTLEKDVFVYDSNNLLMRNFSYAFTNGSFATTPYDNQNYYYESYFPAAIKGVTRKDLSTYPNPADKQLYLSIPIATPVNVYVYNSVGELILKQEKIANIKQLDVAILPPGDYLLIINEMQGNISYQTKFIKQ